MKCKLPKCFDQLPKREQQALTDAMNEKIEQEFYRCQADLQKAWIKMQMIMLHRAFGFDEKRLFTAIGNWWQVYHQVSRVTTNEERDAYLDGEMAKIFPHGYPTDFIDTL